MKNFSCRWGESPPPHLICKYEERRELWHFYHRMVGPNLIVNERIDSHSDKSKRIARRNGSCFFLSMKNSETLFNELKFCCELTLRDLSEFICYFTYRKRSCLSLSLFRITSKKKTMNAEISALVIEVPTPITIWRVPASLAMFTWKTFENRIENKNAFQ